MVDLNKYSEKEVVAAIKVVEEILDVEEFRIDLRKGTHTDAEWMHDESIEGKQVFGIKDLQGQGGYAEFDVFSNLGQLVDRLEIPHDDYFYISYDKRIEAGEDIPRDDWDRKVLIFLENDYVSELLSCVDVETYQAYKDNGLDDISLNAGEIEKYVIDGRFDAVGYLCDKSIAIKLMDTQEAYPMVEYNNSIYVAAHGDWYDNVQQMLDDLKAGENSFCNNFSNYGTLVETELYQVKDDMNDLGLYDDKDNWSFYLSEYELEYIGLGDEKDKFKEEHEDILMLSVTLELEKEMEGQGDEMFYRYAIGDFKLWFAQNIENGNIYSVGLREQGSELDNFDLHVSADEEGKGGYYPNHFFLSGRSGSMTTDEARKYMYDMKKACAVLDKVEEFFKTSKHYELYCKLHNCEKTVDDVLKDAQTKYNEAIKQSVASFKANEILNSDKAQYFLKNIGEIEKE